MAQIHLVVGPVGSGKSTFARKLCHERNAVLLNLDEWMTRLFSPDRPEAGIVEWYVERASRCVDQIWQITLDLLRARIDVVLEIGLIRSHDREALYSRVDAEALDLTIHVIDAPRELRRARVARRNIERGATFAMEVSPRLFELASDMWEPLTEIECDGRDVRFVSVDG